MKTFRRNYIFPYCIAFVMMLALSVSQAFAEIYSYDPAGRLTSVTYDDGSGIAYTYDNNGNILTVEPSSPTLYGSYDTDQDWLIGNFELLDAIDDWAAGSLGNFPLLDLIDMWAFGSYCWDTSTSNHKAGTPDGSGACQ